MSASKTALASSGQKKAQALKLCPQCRQVIIPVMLVVNSRKGRMVWRHKMSLMEECDNPNK